jgi:release factor glutamine methyltransferase
LSTLQELFYRGLSLLKELPQPSLEAKLLLLKSASLEEAQFFANPRQTLSKREEKLYFRLIKKRLVGIPLSYLTGIKEFWSILFRVSPGVLIPRPETELIVEKVIEKSSRKEGLIVDIGTGCGNIAVSLAKELPLANIIATDVSRRALKIARVNAELQGLGRIKFIQGKLFSPLKKLNLEGKCDFVISNPPYLSAKDWEELPAEIREHEPRKALLAGESGLEVIKKIVRRSPQFLKPGGWLILEIGVGQSPEALGFFNSHWKEISLARDLSQIPRGVLAQKA